MPRRLRQDYPGAWHHVFNRGVAKRTLFESDRDVRKFQSLLARRVRAGEIEIHAFAFLHTHFHLLLRSPQGRLSQAMQRVQDMYARWFNMGRRRDGPLFRGRYGNRVIESDVYWTTVVAYIHANPVSAGIVGRAEEYLQSSARHHAAGAGPPWLRRDVVQGTLGALSPDGERPSMGRGLAWIVARRLHADRNRDDDPLDALVGARRDEILAWMERKASLADGTSPGWVLLSPETVGLAVSVRRERGEKPPLHKEGRSPPGWEVVEAGLLRAFCGLSQEEVSLRMGLARGTTRDRIEAYAAAIRGGGEFRRLAATLLWESLAREFPGAGRAGTIVSPETMVPRLPRGARSGSQ